MGKLSDRSGQKFIHSCTLSVASSLIAKVHVSQVRNDAIDNALHVTIVTSKRKQMRMYSHRMNEHRERSGAERNKAVYWNNTFPQEPQPSLFDFRPCIRSALCARPRVTKTIARV